jgi:D-glycero-alpha-D-manno-heptose-7-phosphate kinase
MRCMAWETRRARLSSSSGNLDEAINRWYELGQANGARRGKQFGAGGGGFLLFHAEEPAKMRGDGR